MPMTPSSSRVFAPDSKPYDGRPVYENLPVYRTPTWLMTGVWMSDSSGFAVTPPRADSDAVAVRPVEPPQPQTGAYERTASRDSGLGTRDSNPPSSPNPESRIPSAESELMIARGESEESRPASEPDKPRIEQYRER